MGGGNEGGVMCGVGWGGVAGGLGECEGGGSHGGESHEGGVMR